MKVKVFYWELEVEEYFRIFLQCSQISKENSPIWKESGAETNGGDGEAVPGAKKNGMRGANADFIHLSIFVVLLCFPWIIVVFAQPGMSQGMS